MNLIYLEVVNLLSVVLVSVLLSVGITRIWRYALGVNDDETINQYAPLVWLTNRITVRRLKKMTYPVSGDLEMNLNAAISYMTWEKPFGMCAACNNFWVSFFTSLGMLLYINFNIFWCVIFVLLVVLISHQIITK